MAWTKLIAPLIVIFCVSIRETVSQVQMSVNPEQVVLGSLSPVGTTFTCTISGSANILRIYTMQILSKRETDLEFVVVGEAEDSKPVFAASAPQDIVSKGSMSGGIDSNTPTASTLILTMSTQDVVCTDKGHYQCIVVYKNTSSKTVTAQSNVTFSVYALPSDVSMSAKKDNMNIQGTGPGDSAAIVNVGETVEFTCSAKIGSDNTTRLRWKRTSEFGGGNFIPYQQQEDIDDGTSSSMETDCSYTRTATLRYNVTLSDVNRNNDLAFQCYVSIDAPGQGTVETQNPPTFYINAGIDDESPSNLHFSHCSLSENWVWTWFGGVLECFNESKYPMTYQQSPTVEWEEQHWTGVIQTIAIRKRRCSLY